MDTRKVIDQQYRNCNIILRSELETSGECWPVIAEVCAISKQLPMRFEQYNSDSNEPSCMLLVGYTISARREAALRPTGTHHPAARVISHYLNSKHISLAQIHNDVIVSL